MSQISSLRSLPDPIPNIAPDTLKTGSLRSAATTTPAKVTPTLSDETQSSPLQAQLTHFSAVLTSLQNTTASTRSQYVQAYNQVRSGAYSINSLDVSKSIVSDLLTKQ